MSHRLHPHMKYIKSSAKDKVIVSFILLPPCQATLILYQRVDHHHIKTHKLSDSQPSVKEEANYYRAKL